MEDKIDEMKKLNLKIDNWGSRYFSLFNNDDLIAVFVYKKGAKHVKEILEKMESQLDEMAGIVKEDSGIEGPVEGGFKYDRWANGSRKS